METYTACDYVKNSIRKICRFIECYSQPATIILVLLVFTLSTTLSLMSGDQLRYPDEHDYNRLAQSINTGNGYVNTEGDPTAYRPPGWPLILSFVYRVIPRPVAGKMFNVFALTSVAWLLSILVAKNAPAGRCLAPLLILLYPAGLYTATTLYPQIFETLLLVAILVMLNSGNPTTLRSIFTGFLLGVLVLSIPSFILVIPLILAGLFFTQNKLLTANIRQQVIILLCAVLVVLPWVVRNTTVFHTFVPVSTNSGENLLLSNSENTRPNNGVNVDISRYLEATKGMNEAERDSQLRQYAVTWIYNNPGSAFYLYLRKVLNYFNFRNELYVKSVQSHLKDTIMFLSYYPLLLIAILRLFMHKRMLLSSIERLMYIIYFGNVVVSAIFFTRIRFRIPFDIMLIGVVGIAIGRWISVVNSNSVEQGV